MLAFTNIVLLIRALNSYLDACKRKREREAQSSNSLFTALPSLRHIDYVHDGSLPPCQA